MLIFIVVIVILFSVFLFLKGNGREIERIDKAFAGAPKAGDTVVELSCESNKPIFIEDGIEVDLSKKRKFILDGSSLEPLGLPDGTIVYTDLEYNSDELFSLAGLFVILRIDNDRIMKEHPDKTNRLEGYKARKAVDCFLTSMEKNVFLERMTNILKKDKDVQERNIADCTERLWKKFKFAVEYYKNDTHILVSLTYKDGKYKDYSFHSLKLLEGIVRYKNIDVIKK